MGQSMSDCFAIQFEPLISYSCPMSRTRLAEWFRGVPGRFVRAEERHHLDQLLPNLFGYHLALIGSVGDDDELLLTSRVAHHIVVDPLSDGDDRSAVHAAADALPFGEGSLDVVLLLHTLELEENPHEVLREVLRVLVPEGHVVITGFNPWSWWGVWRLLRRHRGEVPWSGRFISQTRIRDWLALVGFETVDTRCFFFRMPLGSERIMARTNFLERFGPRWWPIFCGVYVVVARKRVSTLTPIRPRWRSRRRMLGGVVEPTTRGVQRGK